MKYVITYDEHKDIIQKLKNMINKKSIIDNESYQSDTIYSEYIKISNDGLKEVFDKKIERISNIWKA